MIDIEDIINCIKNYKNDYYYNFSTKKIETLKNEDNILISKLLDEDYLEIKKLTINEIDDEKIKNSLINLTHEEIINNLKETKVKIIYDKYYLRKCKYVAKDFLRNNSIEYSNYLLRRSIILMVKNNLLHLLNKNVFFKPIYIVTKNFSFAVSLKKDEEGFKILFFNSLKDFDNYYFINETKNLELNDLMESLCQYKLIILFEDNKKIFRKWNEESRLNFSDNLYVGFYEKRFAFYAKPILEIRENLCLDCLKYVFKSLHYILKYNLSCEDDRVLHFDFRISENFEVSTLNESNFDNEVFYPKINLNFSSMQNNNLDVYFYFECFGIEDKNYIYILKMIDKYTLEKVYYDEIIITSNDDFNILMQNLYDYFLKYGVPNSITISDFFTFSLIEQLHINSEFKFGINKTINNKLN